jgi:hypothetical protein
MQHKSVVGSIAVAIVVISLMLGAGGCTPKPQEAVDVTDVPLIPDAGPDEVQIPQSQFEWTEAPAIESIPEGTIVGMINGQPFEAKTVRVQKRNKGPQIRISDGIPDTPTGSISKDIGIDLRFPLEEGAAGEYSTSFEDKKDFDTAHAFFWYPKSDGKGSMSVNPKWGAAMEVTEWTLEEDPDNKDIIGNIKGRVAITFGDDEKSWVAGSFDVIYYE